MTNSFLMRGLCVGAAVLAALPAAHGQAAFDPLRASAALASDYVHNGLLQTTGGPALRLAFDYEHPTGFFGGGSLASVDFELDEVFDSQRSTQQVLYVGYVWKQPRWMTNLTLSQYLYPDSARDYDYTQTALSVAYRDRFFFTASHSSDYFDVYDRMEQVRAGVALPWIWNLELGVNAGKLRYEGRFAAEYTHWDIGLSRPAGRFALDLRFHDSTLDRLSLAGNPTDNQWVLSMTYSLLPLQRSQDRR